MKNTMYKAGTTLLLMSALIAGGTIAITHPTNVFAADTAGEEDSDPIASGSPNDPDGWDDDPTWSLYKINNNSNNLILHIEAGTNLSQNNANWQSYSSKISKIVFDNKVTASTTLSKLFQGYTNLTDIKGLQNLDVSKTTDFSYMFDDDPLLTSLDLSNFDASNSINFSYMFANDPLLTSLDLSGFDASKSKSFTSMFANDSSLTSLDLSKLNMTYTNDVGINNMLSGDTKLESLTLSQNNVLKGYNGNVGLSNTISTDTMTYENWKQSDDTDDSTTRSADDLMQLYFLDIHATRPSGTITWVPVVKSYKTKMYLQYVDADNPAKVLYGDENNNAGTATFDENSNVDIVNSFTGKYNPSENNLYFSGYEADKTEDPTNTITIPAHDSTDKAIPVKLKKLDPVKINVNITDENGTTSDKSFTIPVNDTDYSYKNIDFPSQELDLDKSTITINGTEESLADYTKGSKSSDTDLNSILSSEITNSMTKKDALVDGSTKSVPMYQDSNSGDNPISINAVYKKTDSGDSGNSGNNNNNNGGNVDTGTITDNKQVIAIGEKTVPLYNSKGELLPDYALTKNSDWQSDKQLVLNGVTYYRVSTNAWVKASDVYPFKYEDSYVSVHNDKFAKLVNFKNVESNRGLRASSDWKTDRFIDISGTKYYRVSTNEFVSSDNVYQYKPTSNKVVDTDGAEIYDDYGTDTGKTLKSGSYKTDRIATINGTDYYRVSTNQFIKVN